MDYHIHVDFILYFTWHGYFTLKIQLALKDYPTYITTSIKAGTYKGTVDQDFEDLIKHNDKGRHCFGAVRGICRSIHDNDDDGGPLSCSKSESAFLRSNHQKNSSFYFSSSLDRSRFCFLSCIYKFLVNKLIIYLILFFYLSVRGFFFVSQLLTTKSFLEPQLFKKFKLDSQFLIQSRIALSQNESTCETENFFIKRNWVGRILL